MTNRIVSLIASATEIVYALGFGKELVGRSHECDYPPAVKDLPMCTSPKFNVEGTSYEIDQRVKAILQEAVSVYRVDAKMLDDLAPSHIITQAQCEVCAVSLKDVEAAACEMIKSQPAIVSLEPNCLNDIWKDIDRVASALGANQFGHPVAGCHQRFDPFDASNCRSSLDFRGSKFDRIHSRFQLGDQLSALLLSA